jgi:hypothetical protein
MTRVERRAFIVGTFALLTAPLAAEAQHARKIVRIAFISTTASLESPTTSAFRQGLQELGYVEGQNILIEWRWGGGTTERLPTFAAEVIGLNVDVIVAANDTVGRAAQRLTKTADDSGAERRTAMTTSEPTDYGQAKARLEALWPEMANAFPREESIAPPEEQHAASAPSNADVVAGPATPVASKAKGPRPRRRTGREHLPPGWRLLDQVLRGWSPDPRKLGEHTP